jgi:hypothetical protein
MSDTVLKITLYDQDNEVRAEFTRLFVPWKLLKASIRLMKKLDVNNITEEIVDELAALVVDIFGNQFTADELNEGADIQEMMTVIMALQAKAGALNPTRPA